MRSCNIRIDKSTKNVRGLFRIISHHINYSKFKNKKGQNSYVERQI